jgi:hypothetical protein
MRNPVAAQVVICLSLALQSFVNATEADHGSFGGHKCGQTRNGKAESKKSCRQRDSSPTYIRKKQRHTKESRSGRSSEIIAYQSQYAEPQLKKVVTQPKVDHNHNASRKSVDAIGRQDLANWKEGSGRSKDWRRSKSWKKRDSLSVDIVSRAHDSEEAREYEKTAESPLPSALLRRSSQPKTTRLVRNSRLKTGVTRHTENQLWREAQREWGSEWDHEGLEFLNDDS